MKKFNRGLYDNQACQSHLQINWFENYIDTFQQGDFRNMGKRKIKIHRQEKRTDRLVGFFVCFNLQ